MIGLLSTENLGGTARELYLQSTEFYMSTFLRERPVFNRYGEDEPPSHTWWKINGHETGKKFGGIEQPFRYYLDENFSNSGREPDDRNSWLVSTQRAFEVVDTGFKGLMLDTNEKATLLRDILSHVRSPRIQSMMNPSVARDLEDLARRRYDSWITRNNLVEKDTQITQETT